MASRSARSSPDFIRAVLEAKNESGRNPAWGGGMIPTSTVCAAPLAVRAVME